MLKNVINYNYNKIYIILKEFHKNEKEIDDHPSKFRLSKNEDSANANNK